MKTKQTKDGNHLKIYMSICPYQDCQEPIFSRGLTKEEVKNLRPGFHVLQHDRDTAVRRIVLQECGCGRKPITGVTIKISEKKARRLGYEN